MEHYTRIEFYRFKAFKTFSIDLRAMNVLVGPNNAGKSTILTAFRILAAALRKASARKPLLIPGPHGRVLGYDVDLSSISVAAENIFYNYEEHEPATVRFQLSNGGSLLLFFPEREVCVLIPDAQGKAIGGPGAFKRYFDAPIGFAPILGPVEHHEILYDKEAARLALINYGAARNSRNIWYHYPEKFEVFESSVAATWPGMSVERPTVNHSYSKPSLNMFCPEGRYPRELFWAGFGFQVWCQMLTHMIQQSESSLFLIDEPDIYLHSDLQRQLVSLLRNLGPDILIATHSTEIIAEAETADILYIQKGKSTARRLKDTSQLGQVFRDLGSGMNPVLTQVAKTRRVLFVEGKDFQVYSKVALKLKYPDVGFRRTFAVVPLQGFNPERARSLKAGMEETLGVSVEAALILDRDYRSQKECDAIKTQCNGFADLVSILDRKEIENFLLCPEAIDRAAARRVAEKNRRTGTKSAYSPMARALFDAFCDLQRSEVTGQLQWRRKESERELRSGIHEATINKQILNEIEAAWNSYEGRVAIIPGKDALGFIKKGIQDRYGVSVTDNAIIDSIRLDELSGDLVDLMRELDIFAHRTVD